MKNFFLFTLTGALLFIWGCDPGWGYRITRPQVERTEQHYELSFHDLKLQIEANSFVLRDHFEFVFFTEAESATLPPGIISLQMLSQPEHIHTPEISLILRDENKQIIAQEKTAGTTIPKEPLTIKKGQKLYLLATSFTMQTVNRQGLPDEERSEFLFHYYFPGTGESFKCVFAYDPDFVSY